MKRYIRTAFLICAAIGTVYFILKYFGSGSAEEDA